MSDFPFPIRPVFSEERGEGWVASRDIAVREMVLRVMPLAAVPNKDALRSICAACFTTLKPAPCSLCPLCKFVSLCPTCLSSDGKQSKGHASECEALSLLEKESDGKDTTALRLILQLACSRREFASSGLTIGLTGDEGEEEEEEPVIVDSLVEDVDDLFGTDDDLSEEALVTYEQVCQRIRHLLPARYRTSLHHLMQLAAKLHFNGMDITRKPTLADGEEDKTSVLRQGKAVGEALYPSASRFNHSCDPNCGLSFAQNGRLEVRAAKRILKGEEMFISYVGVDHLTNEGGEGTARNKGEIRRRRLLKTYGFQCKCKICLAEERGR